MIITEWLSFYADTDTEKNKHFKWKINSIIDLPGRLKYWAKKVEIRSAWYVCYENEKVIANQRIDIQSFYETSGNEVHFVK
jgi:hypothetical protein